MNSTIVMIDWTKPVMRVPRSGRSRRPPGRRRRARRAHRDRGRRARRARRSRVDGGLQRAGRCPGSRASRRGTARRRRRRPRSGRPTRADPRRPASRAMRSAGNRASSGARKSSRAVAMRSGGGGRRRPAVRIGQGVLDGKSHIRGAQLGLERAVDEPDGRVDDALRVDDDLDGVVADIVQPVRLDDLQALVREGRRVDGDLGAHRPGRVAQGLRRRDRGHAPRPSASRNGPPDAVRISAATPAIDSPTRHCQIAECSESIGRSQASGLANGSAGRRRGDRRRRAAGPAASPGGRPRRASPCWRSRRPCPAASAARTGRRLTTPPVPMTTRSTSSRVTSSIEGIGAADRVVPAAGPADGGVVREGDDQRPEPARLLGEESRRSSRSRGPRPGTRPGAPRGRRPPGGRSTRSTRSGRPDRRRPARADAQPKTATTYSVTIGAANRNESTRSRIPPWPGMRSPESFCAGGALDDRLGEVAGLGGQRGQRTEDDRVERALADGPQHERDHDASWRRPRR